MKRFFRGLLGSALFGPTLIAVACGTWGEVRQVGQLDGRVLPEASGFAFSQLEPQHLYAVNDSSGPSFVVMNRDGSSPRTLRLSGVPDRRIDIEDLAVGPCGEAGAPASCLFIPNSGGNNYRRERFEVYLVREAEIRGEEVAPYAQLTLRYPDGPHDAEGFAVHPEGDLYVLSKEGPLSGAASRLYRLPAARWQNDPQGEHVLEHVADIALSELVPSRLDLFSQLATALDIAPDGERMLVLTYGDAFELELDPNSLPVGQTTRLGAEGRHSRAVLERLPQQESLAYLPDGSGFVYSSEAQGQPQVPLYELRCETP